MPIHLLDNHLLNTQEKPRLAGWTRFTVEFLYFGIKEARSCLFVALFFALLGRTLGNTAGALLFEHGVNYLWMAAGGLAGLLACGVLFLPLAPQELAGESIN